jgi:hypothetical protein
MSQPKERERILDQLDAGQITADQAEEQLLALENRKMTRCKIEINGEEETIRKIVDKLSEAICETQF